MPKENLSDIKDSAKKKADPKDISTPYAIVGIALFVLTILALVVYNLMR